MVCTSRAAVLGSRTRVDADNRSLTNPLTGEPDAGDPPVRFGGRGSGQPLSLPLSRLGEPRAVSAHRATLALMGIPALASLPMRLLDRYLLRELLTPLGYCLGGILIFWISFDLYSELSEFQKNRLTGADILQYYVVQLPEMLVFPLLPVVLLLALLYALTNHARHNELTAMRAAGVSLWRFSFSYLWFGRVVCPGGFFI